MAATKKAEKKKRKEVVIESADEIDQQTMQYLNNTSMLGGNNEEVQAAIDSVFWRKTVKGVLTPEQFEKYKTFLAERKKARIDARIDAFVLKDERRPRHDRRTNRTVRRAR